VAFCRHLALQGSREAQKYAINFQTDDFKEVLSYSHLMGTIPAASILRHFQPSRMLRQKYSPRHRGAAMQLATERDAKWLSSVDCYEILSAGPAGKLLARKPGDLRATKTQAKAQASFLTSRSSNDHEFGSSAGIVIVRLRLRLAAL
jgi:hypothetical protein